MVICCYAFDQHWILFPFMWHLPQLSQGVPREAKMRLRLIAETDARSVGDSHPSCNNSFTVTTRNSWRINVYVRTMNFLVNKPNLKYLPNFLLHYDRNRISHQWLTELERFLNSNIRRIWGVVESLIIILLQISYKKICRDECSSFALKESSVSFSDSRWLFAKQWPIFKILSSSDAARNLQ